MDAERNTGSEYRPIVIANPTALEAEADPDRASNLLRRVLSVIKDVRPGLDLVSVKYKAPPYFNMPKSLLQCYGESVYCVGVDMLAKCNAGKTAVERLAAVVGWSISTCRPLVFGALPYNSILGETHHVSKGTLNILLEQVSHHPPIAALHATDEKESTEMTWCHYYSPKFRGTCVETEVRGKRELKLLKYGETYIMNSPNIVFKFLPNTDFEWGGKVKVRCPETGLTAELCYKGPTFLGRKAHNRAIKGKIFAQSFSMPICEIDGYWDRTVTMKDNHGNVREIYNASEVMSNLKAPLVHDPKGVWETESAKVWGEVSQGIMSKDWKKAKKAKMTLEERQRELAREREANKEIWVPKHFSLSYSKEAGWDCSALQTPVPQASIVVPL